MRKISNPICALFVAIIATLLFSNCTIIGLATGTGISNTQANNRPTYSLDVQQLEMIPEGTWVEATLKRGRIIDGWFVKVDYQVVDNKTTTHSVIIDSPNNEKHHSIPTSEIKNMKKGKTNNTPVIVSGAVGAGVDIMIFTWVMVKLNEYFDGEH